MYDYRHFGPGRLRGVMHQSEFRISDDARGAPVLYTWLGQRNWCNIQYLCSAQCIMAGPEVRGRLRLLATLVDWSARQVSARTVLRAQRAGS